MNNHQDWQFLATSVWVPLGVNNLAKLRHVVYDYLDRNQARIGYKDFCDIALNDLGLTAYLQFSAPDELGELATLRMEIRYLGWGYIQFVISNVTAPSPMQTLTPHFVNEIMFFLLQKMTLIIPDTLLGYQRNYFSNVLFGNGILSAEEYVRAARNKELNNGIMDGATDEEIRRGFRYGDYKDGLLRSKEPEEADQFRSNDWITQTIVLHRSTSLQSPSSYDTRDGAFGKFPDVIPSHYVRGRHRSSILILEQFDIQEQRLVDFICAINALIRSTRQIISIMVGVREQLSLTRIALLHKEGIRFDRIIPEDVYNAEVEHLQSYVLYLLSRIPLLGELLDYVNEAHGKVSALERCINEQKLVNSLQLDDDFRLELQSTSEYFQDLVLTASRILKGLEEEIASVGHLVELHAQNRSYTVSARTEIVLNEIKKIQSNTQLLAQTQNTMQKRALETQFIQNEFSRSNEVRQRIGRRATQLTGAAASAGLLTSASRGVVTVLLAALFGVEFPSDDPTAFGNILVNAALPIVLSVIAWFIIGSILSGTRHFGDIVEIIAPLELDHAIFDERRFLDKCFADSDRIPKKHLHRLRIEGNSYRITWEDEIRTDELGKTNTVFATIEYRAEKGNFELVLLMMSAEKSKDNNSMVELRKHLIDLAAERIAWLTQEDLSERGKAKARWEMRLEQIIDPDTSGQQTSWLLFN